MREENLKDDFYSLPKFNLAPNNSKQLMQFGLKTFAFENEILFKSKKELMHWLDHESFSSEDKQKIVKTIKRKELFVEKFTRYENQISNTEEGISILKHDTRIFLHFLDKIEDDPAFRLVLKIILNLNINYLNCEISQIENISVSLNFIEMLKNLYKNPWSSHKGNFFVAVHKFLGLYSSRIKNIKHLSIQQRIFRDFKKIKKMYTEDDLCTLLPAIKDNFHMDLLDIQPLFLSTYSTEYYELISETESFRKLKAADLSNNQLESFPSSLKNAFELGYVDLSNNRFSEIPEELFSLANPKVIIMSNQYMDLNERSVIRYKTSYPHCRIIQ